MKSSEGLDTFVKGARGAIFGWDHPDINSDRIESTQTISGTGALNILSEFLFKFSNRPVYISNPGQDNLKRIFENRGLKVKEYRYFDKKKKCIDIDGMLEDLKNA